MVGRDPTPYIQPEVSSSSEEEDEDMGVEEAGDAGTGGGGPFSLAGAEGGAQGTAGQAGAGAGGATGRGAPLLCSVQVEREAYELAKAHNTWGLVTLAAADSGFSFGLADRVGVDLAVVIDTSGSMQHRDKLASVLATIEYILDVLSERDRLALVAFSDEATVLCGLLPMLPSNKSKVLSALHQVKAGGNTNLSGGLFCGLDLLCSGEQASDVFRLPRLFLLTDGLANRGLTQGSILDTLSKREMPENLSIQCFGYGSDHSSSTLQSIAFRSPGGLYYFVPDAESIAGTFGECLGGIFSTVAHSVTVTVEAFDGCRLIQFKTKCPVEAVTVMKAYTIKYGCVYEQERRSTVVRLSLRGLRSVQAHHLLRVTLAYTSVFDGKRYTDVQDVHVERRPETTADRQNYNKELDRQLNRIQSAEAIDKALAAVASSNFSYAREVLRAAISHIQVSVTARDAFCLDLVSDLRECLSSMEDREYFATTGVHDAHGYSTMYNQERSVGPGAAKRRQRRAGRGYGYHTTSQLAEANHAKTTASGYLSGYLSYPDDC